MSRAFLAICAVILSLDVATSARAQDLRIVLAGAGRDLKNPVAIVPLGSRTLEPGVFLFLEPAAATPDAGRHALGQVFDDGSGRFLALAIDAIGGSEEVALSGRRPQADRKLPGIDFRQAEADVRVRWMDELLLVHRNTAGHKPYVWPLIGPTGSAVTRSYPMLDVEGEDRDHNHQRSFWFSHGDVNGFDFWAADALNSPNERFGTIRETGRRIVTSGPLVGILQTTNDWCGPDGKPICQDERILRAYLTTPTQRLLDFEITIKATKGPVTFGDTKEGSFGLRLASSMDVNKKTGGKITNAEGQTDLDAWGKASPWVDYVGPVDGETVGVAILNHPDSFRYPTTWHVRDYGLFAANPFGYHDFKVGKPGAHTIAEGGTITLKYRVILHEGTTDTADVAGAFAAYANPPLATVKAE